MAWMQNARRMISEATSASPIECPRGWGPVAFQLEVGGFLPFFAVERKCPISGSQTCAVCAHPVNPETTDRLRQLLEELEQLRRERILSEAECDARRKLILGVVPEPGARRSRQFRTAAWILGPLGLVVGGCGAWLGATQDAAFYVIAGVGVVALALTLSFAVLAGSRAPVDDKR